MIALCDALIQTPDHAGAIEAEVLAPLHAAIVPTAAARLPRPRRRELIFTPWYGARVEP